MNTIEITYMYRHYAIMFTAVAQNKKDNKIMKDVRKTLNNSKIP